MRLRSTRIGLLAALLAFGAPQIGQSLDAQQATRRPASGKEHRLQKKQADAHDRVELFPKNRDRFEIIGLAQGDNDFRKNTPALQKSDKVSAQVDTVALRERLLASFAGETQFTTPLPLAGQGNRSFPVKAGQHLEQAESEPALEAEEDDTPKALLWMLSLPLGTLALIYGIRRLLSR